MSTVSLICGATGSVAADIVSEDRNRPLLTIDALLTHKAPSVNAIRWYDSDHLVVDFMESELGYSTARKLSIAGKLEDTLGEGRYSSSSPDGRLLLQQTDAGWVVRDLKLEAFIKIAEPLVESRNFVSYSAPIWSPDGRYAAIAGYYDPPQSGAVAEPIVLAGVQVVDVSNQLPSIERAVSRITIFDRSAPTAVQRLLVKGLAIAIAWGPRGSLYISQTDFSGPAAATTVLRFRPGESQAQAIYRSPGRFGSMTPVVRPNGAEMALVLDIDNRAWEDFMSLLLIDATTGQELRRLTNNLPVLGDDYVWSPQGNEIYVRVRHGGLDQIYSVPLVGEPRPLTHGLRQHFNLGLAPDGRRLSYQTIDGYGRKDIRVLDLQTGEERVVLVLDEPASQFALGEWQHVRWESSDGVHPFGFLVLPPNFDPDNEYPMIVDVHGGGEGSSLSLTAPLTIGVAPGPLEWHVWAALGYVVFVPDYRSTGDYGPEVITDRYRSGEIGAIKDVEDIVSGTRFVVDQGFIDADRIAILGHSAGGQRVYILLTQSNIYAAAILNESIAPDPTSLFIEHASGDNAGGYPAGAYRHMYGGDISEFPDRYKENYMFDSYRIDTPTLILLGNEQLGGIYHMPNEVIYSILKQCGVPTRMLKFVDEGHVYTRPESAKLAFAEVRSWVEMHMPNP